MVKLSLLEEKITGVPKSRPRGTLLPAACCRRTVDKQEVQFAAETCCMLSSDPQIPALKLLSPLRGFPLW